MRKWLFISFMVIVIAVVISVAALIGGGWLGFLSMVHDLTTTEITSYTDEFHVTVLETKSAQNSFTERVRVNFVQNMKIGIEVIDLKETGIHEMHGTNGETFYRVGNPYKAGQSAPVRARGKSSSCEVFFSVSTTSSNTIWQSSISAATTNTFSHSEDTSSVGTTFPTPMMISDVQTNWPDSYQRGSWIPLANLGDYKIMLTVE